MCPVLIKRLLKEAKKTMWAIHAGEIMYQEETPPGEGGDATWSYTVCQNDELRRVSCRGASLFGMVPELFSVVPPFCLPSFVQGLRAGVGSPEPIS